jgi:hypothetical protein
MSRIRTRTVAALVGALSVGAVALADLNPPASVPGERVPAVDIAPGELITGDEIRRRDALAAVGPQLGLRQRNGAQGVWAVAKSRGAVQAADGNYIINTWGDVRMGLDFGQVVDVVGVDVLGHSAPTTGLVVVGYRDGAEVGRSHRFTSIGSAPAWFAIGLQGVDRIEFLADASNNGAGFYGLDDLTFDRAGARTVLDFEDLDRGSALTGTGYAGLLWEMGTGEFEQVEVGVTPSVIPAPILNIQDEEIGEGAPLEREASRGLGTAPTLDFTFAATRLGDPFANSIPPDTHGAVGPNHVVVITNTALDIRNKTTGARIQISSINSIMPFTSGDPRIKYDQYEGRWVAVSTDFSSRIFMAVSTSSDPTGSWYGFSWVASAGGDTNCFPDYPTLGLDENGYYVGCLMAGCGYTLWSIEKAPLVDPSPSTGVISVWRSIGPATLQPAHTFGSAPGEYVVSNNGSTQTAHWLVTGPLTSPTLNGPFVLSSSGAFPPPNAKALGSSPDLDTLDGRFMNCIHRDGNTYYIKCTSFGGRSAIRWYRADLAGNTMLETAFLSDSQLYLNMPSIGVNSRGTVVVGCSGSNASQYASAYYSGRIPTDPAGELSDVQLYRAGVGSINHPDGFGRNRFGDYSHTAIDPVDDKTFWTFQEYGQTGNDWAVQVAKLTLLAAPADFSLLTPADGATGVDSTSIIGLDWEDSEDATQYTVEVFEDAGLSTPAIPAFVVASSDADIAANDLDPDATYYWTATAQNTSGDTTPTPVSFDFTTAPGPSCPGDVDGDGDTDVFDFADLSANFGAGPGATREMGDLTGDGFVNVFDFAELSGDFGCMP